MEISDSSARQGSRLLQFGALFFLLALLVGLIVPRFAAPRLALSTHLLGIMQGIFLMLLGLLWPRLQLGRVGARVGFFLAVYGCASAWMANLLAAIWGAGNSMLPIAAGMAHGSAIQERIIAIALRSAAVSLIALAVVLLWGFRTVGGGQVNK